MSLIAVTSTSKLATLLPSVGVLVIAGALALWLRWRFRPKATTSPATGREIERKFLVRLDGSALRAGVPIRQGYLAVGDPEIRVRFTPGACEMTVKAAVPGDETGLEREEIPIPVAPEQAARLLELCRTRRVAKTRYRMGGWEIDVYEGHLRGLVIAEAELPSREAPLPARPEGVVFGPEVTGDKRLKNQALAQLSLDAANALLIDVHTRLFY